MDEPTAFLDVAGRYEVLHLMHLLSTNSDKTVIFSTHDLQMAISQSDKIWLILDNKLIEGAPEDLMIAGAFDNLFDSSAVQFNSEDGTFSFRSDKKGSIFIEGIPSESNNFWQLSTHSAAQKFKSIYELILCLSKM
jgi:iron complex transport system ATP-binding protein